MGFQDNSPIANIRCITGIVTAMTGSWTEAKVESTKRAGRKMIILFNRGVTKIFWTFEGADVGTPQDIRNCHALKAGSTISLPISDNIPVYVRSASGTNKVVVSELA